MARLPRAAKPLIPRHRETSGEDREANPYDLVLRPDARPWLQASPATSPNAACDSRVRLSLAAGDGLAQDVELLIRDFLEQGAVAFLADSLQDGYGVQADEVREIVVLGHAGH